MATKKNVNTSLQSLHDKPYHTSLQSLHDKPYLSLELCAPQAILNENPVLHICHCSNQRHYLLQRYTCKRIRLEREANYLLEFFLYTPKIH